MILAGSVFGVLCLLYAIFGNLGASLFCGAFAVGSFVWAGIEEKRMTEQLTEQAPIAAKQLVRSSSTGQGFWHDHDDARGLLTKMPCISVAIPGRDTAAGVVLIMRDGSVRSVAAQHGHRRANQSAPFAKAPSRWPDSPPSTPASSERSSPVTDTIIGYINPDGSHEGDYVAGAPGDAGEAGAGHPPATSGHIFHDSIEGCGYRWEVHDTKRVGARLPFGCPDEAAAREEWGR